MEYFKKIVKNIEDPLIFVSKESYRNLALVKDFGNSMLGLIDRLKSCENQPVGDETASRGYMDTVAALESMFVAFDRLSVHYKRDRIDTALRLVQEIKSWVATARKMPSPGKNRDDVSAIRDGKTCCDKLALPVQYVKGIGPKISHLLDKKNIRTVEDLLFSLPRKYEDRRLVKKISETVVGMTETIVARVVNARIQRYRSARTFEATLDDGSGLLTAKWFKGNFAYLKKTFREDAHCILTGEVKSYLFGKDMIHPDYEILDEKDGALLHFNRIVPVYSETAGLHQKYLRKIMQQVVRNYAEYVTSPIPEDVCRRNQLADMDFSIRNVHFPDSDQDIDSYNAFKSSPHRRIIFDEFFFFELGMALKKKGYVLEKGISFEMGGTVVKKFLDILPFELTDAQKRVIGEIRSDMVKPYSMNRLMQGDVGSGKTVVSMVPMITACENGYQSAIMAPTEILAEQHFSNIKNWADALDLKVALLTGSTKSKHRNDVLKRIEEGVVDIIVGTHALIQEGVSFKNLGFVVIDEQHRFGVVQRSILREKGMNPDVLVMTATPIPRTLAMTVYGDLDLSVIDELPPGKKPIKTKVFYEKNRDRVYEIVRKELVKGNQAFIVYPLVEESETLDLKDATGMARHLQDDIFPEFNVGLIHGRMKGSEKTTVMNNFLKKSLDILVSTTVIEVGIDIPTASLMIIEHAERFGLSQLHQLRGRVGRSDLPSYCILIAHHHGSDDSRRRLRTMEQTNDGFTIAEEDLSIRGPGEFMGTRQSGLPDFRVANILRDFTLLATAREEAFMIVTKDPFLQNPEHALLKDVLLRRWKGRLELAKTG